MDASNRDLVVSNLQEARTLLDQVLSNEPLLDSIVLAGQLMSTALEQKHGLFSCGNGGSMADAIHFAEELAGKFRNHRRPLRAQAIADPGFLSCTANDFGWDQVFARYLQAHGNPGDVLLAISTSGNSNNVVEAARMAKSLNMKVVALTGNSGGTLGSLADVHINIPHFGYADRIQEVHIKVIHILIASMEKHLGLA